jgi:hypothetical protein
MCVYEREKERLTHSILADVLVVPLQCTPAQERAFSIYHPITASDHIYIRELKFPSRHEWKPNFVQKEIKSQSTFSWKIDPAFSLVICSSTMVFYIQFHLNWTNYLQFLKKKTKIIELLCATTAEIFLPNVQYFSAYRNYWWISTKPDWKQNHDSTGARSTIRSSNSLRGKKKKLPTKLT